MYSIALNHQGLTLQLPRVTEILKAYSPYTGVPPMILERAAARGTKVHKLCETIADGGWMPDAMISDECRPYVDSFRQWVAKEVKEYLVIEKRMQDDELGYTGQIDFVIRGNDDEVYLADLKTSYKPQKTYPIQMSAYENLLRREGINVKSALLVYLSKEGKYPVIDTVDDFPAKFKIFTNALENYYYFNPKEAA